MRRITQSFSVHTTKSQYAVGYKKLSLDLAVVLVVLLEVHLTINHRNCGHLMNMHQGLCSPCT